MQGTWAAANTLPGAKLVLIITQVHDSVLGNGTYAIEAGRAGTLQLGGHYIAPGITLAINYDYGLTETYSGTVVDSRHMTGTMTDTSGHGFVISFIRR